ncbi:MAG: hypothetical protein LIP12_10560 [Clostridiales bacterium]|nr:hypothetical protein [Clostridiales bacterium]
MTESQIINGLPKGIHTEAQLWDEILKKEVLEMPFLLLPVIAEIHGTTYPSDTKIIPFGTEYSVERVVTKEISSIRSDASVWIESRIYHFECESDTSKKIVKRTFEYDAQAVLSSAEKGTKAVPWQLNFPYSTVFFLEAGTSISNRLACKLCLPVYQEDLRHTVVKYVDYAVPALKVQDYSLQEIREKKLLILIPFTPIRFRKLVKQNNADDKIQKDEDHNQQPRSNYGCSNYDPVSAKLELTNFFHEVILVLDEAVSTGYICEHDRKDILALFRKAMIRVFYNDKYLLEVVNHMTAPVLELERETIVRLQKENENLRSENDAMRLENIALAQEVDTLRAARNPIYRWQRRLKRKH